MTKNVGSQIKFLNIDSLAWVTDPHFEFLGEMQIKMFCAELNIQAADCLAQPIVVSGAYRYSRPFSELAEILLSFVGLVCRINRTEYVQQIASDTDQIEIWSYP